MYKDRHREKQSGAAANDMLDKTKSRVPNVPQVDDLLQVLQYLIDRHTQGQQGVADTAIDGLRLARSAYPTEPHPCLHDASVHVVAQGSKRLMFGNEVLVYDAARYLAVPVDVIAMANVAQASESKPFLGLSISLFPHEFGALMVESGEPLPARSGHDLGLYVAQIDAPLLEALIRLVRLLDAPHDVPVMAPLLWREIHYRLLQGSQADRLARIAMGESPSRRIARAVAWLKGHYDESFQVERLARDVGMSVSAFHQHFKIVTAMTPLQYQKSLRLHEARRQMLVEARDVTTTAHNVGYESASQFIREYARLYGESPLRDIKRMRTALGRVG